MTDQTLDRCVKREALEVGQLAQRISGSDRHLDGGHITHTVQYAARSTVGHPQEKINVRIHERTCLYNLSMTSINVSAARADLPKLIDAVSRGEEVTLTRHGKPVAVLVRPDRLRSRRAEAALADADEIGRLVASGRVQPLSDGIGLAPGRADELVAEVRADRSGR